MIPTIAVTLHKCKCVFIHMQLNFVQEHIQANNHKRLIVLFKGTSIFPSQRASDGETVPIPWRHQDSQSNPTDLPCGTSTCCVPYQKWQVWHMYLMLNSLIHIFTPRTSFALFIGNILMGMVWFDCVIGRNNNDTDTTSCSVFRITCLNYPE